MDRVPVRDGLFKPADASAQLHLIGGLCSSCARRHFPSQDTCPYCGAGDCSTTPLSCTGTVYLCTTVVSRPPGYEGPVPYGFGVVELDDGIRVVTRIVDPERAVAGTAVEITLETIGTDEEGREIVTYAFHPRATSHEKRATPEG